MFFVRFSWTPVYSAQPRSSEKVQEAADGGRNMVRLVHVLWGTVEVLLQNMATQEQVGTGYGGSSVMRIFVSYQVDSGWPWGF